MEFHSNNLQFSHMGVGGKRGKVLGVNFFGVPILPLSISQLMVKSCLLETTLIFSQLPL